MALTKDQKTAQVADLKDKMSKAQSIMFTHYIGLTVGAVSQLRNKLREGEAEMKVAKKTLMRLAAKELGLPEIPEEITQGPVACIFSFSEPLSGAQIAFKFGKENDKVKLVGGFFDGKMLNAKEAMELAQIPSHQTLLAIFAGMCTSPLSGFARALKLIAEQKEVPTVEAVKEEVKAPEATAPVAETTPGTETPATPVEVPAVEPSAPEVTPPAAEAAPAPQASTEPSSPEETPPAA